MTVALNMEKSPWNILFKHHFVTHEFSRVMRKSWPVSYLWHSFYLALTTAEKQNKRFHSLSSLLSSWIVHFKGRSDFKLLQLIIYIKCLFLFNFQVS